MADEELVQRLLRVVTDDGNGLTIAELAARLGKSRPTVSKYLEICEARKLVSSTKIATGRFVTARGGVVKRGPGVKR